MLFIEYNNDSPSENGNQSINPSNHLSIRIPKTECRKKLESFYLYYSGLKGNTPVLRNISKQEETGAAKWSRWGYFSK